MEIRDKFLSIFPSQAAPKLLQVSLLLNMLLIILKLALTNLALHSRRPWHQDLLSSLIFLTHSGLDLLQFGLEIIVIINRILDIEGQILANQECRGIVPVISIVHGITFTHSLIFVLGQFSKPNPSISIFLTFLTSWHKICSHRLMITILG